MFRNLPLEAALAALIATSRTTPFLVDVSEESIRKHERDTLTSMGLMRIGLDLDVYLSLLPLTKAAASTEGGLNLSLTEQEKIARTHAAKLALIFGNDNLAIGYINRFIKRGINTNQPLHDACLFSIPTDPKWDICKHWRGIINNEKNKPSSPEDLVMLLLIRADEIDRYYESLRLKLKSELTDRVSANLKAKGKSDKHLDAIVKKELDKQLPPFTSSTPLSTLNEYLGKLTYPRAHENQDAAKCFIEYNRSNAAFETYLDLKPANDDLAVPNIIIDGSTIAPEYKDYELRKLNAMDCRAGVLGRMTSCCQSFDNAGEKCVIDGITNPNSGFYVLVRKATEMRPEQIVAQSWVRRCGNKILLDSVESQMDFRTKNEVVITDFVMAAGSKLVSEYGIDQVLVGNGGATPSGIKLLEPLAYVKSDYDGYSDARSQSIIADKRIQSELISLYRSRNDLTRFHVTLVPTTKKEDLLYLAELCFNNKTDISFIEDKIIRDEVQLYVDNINEWGSLYSIGQLSSEAVINKMNIILKQGINIDFSGRPKYIPMIIFYSLVGDSKVVEHLLKNGANPNLKQRFGSAALHDACSKGHTSVAGLLIKHGADINVLNEFGETPLLKALNGGHFNAAKLLVKKGANVNLADSSNDVRNKPALHKACRHGPYEAVKLLLDHGADIHQMDGFNQRPLESACAKANMKIIELLLSSGAVVSNLALHKACQNGHMDLARILIEKGADVNSADHNDKTALHYACEKGNIEFVKFCLGKKAAVYLKNNQGNTALHSACSNGYIDIVGLLIDKTNKVDINLKNFAGETALHRTFDGLDEDIVPKIALMLVDKGADATLANNDGRTSLDTARRHGYDLDALMSVNYFSSIEDEVDFDFSISELTLFSSRGKNPSDIKKRICSKLPKEELEKLPLDNSEFTDGILALTKHGVSLDDFLHLEPEKQIVLATDELPWRLLSVGVAFNKLAALELPDLKDLLSWIRRDHNRAMSILSSDHNNYIIDELNQKIDMKINSSLSKKTKYT